MRGERGGKGLERVNLVQSAKISNNYSNGSRGKITHEKKCNQNESAYAKREQERQLKAAIRFTKRVCLLMNGFKATG